MEAPKHESVVAVTVHLVDETGRILDSSLGIIHAFGEIVCVHANLRDKAEKIGDLHCRLRRQVE